MFRLRTGYFISGILTGCVLLFSFLTTIPDGRLHIVFCDVGQGDGIYIRFPDGKNMTIDGGPGETMISCLSKHMPFWDRTIDMAILTHPQKDHLNGLVAVLKRYTVQYLVRSDVENTTEGFMELQKLVKEKNITEKFVTIGEHISIGSSNLSIMWPSKEQIALMRFSKGSDPALQGQTLQVLGASTSATTADVNDASVVISLSYGLFDALLMGDADSRVQGKMMSLNSISQPADGHFRDGILEVLKVPHHGSKTGLTDGFLAYLKGSDPASPDQTLKERPLAVISVGKNSYGHPAPEILLKLENAGFFIKRTDQSEDIEVMSDGERWEVK